MATTASGAIIERDVARPYRITGCAPAALRLDLVVAFLAVAEELHFTRAASTLYLSQSGLSRRISMLEQLLGTSLIVRTTRSVCLTPAGQALQPHARAILRAADDGAAATRAARPTPPPVPVQRR